MCNIDIYKSEYEEYISFYGLKSKLYYMDLNELQEMFSAPEEDWQYYVPLCENCIDRLKELEILYKAREIVNTGVTVREFIKDDSYWEDIDIDEIEDWVESDKVCAEIEKENEEDWIKSRQEEASFIIKNIEETGNIDNGSLSRLKKLEYDFTPEHREAYAKILKAKAEQDAIDRDTKYKSDCAKGGIKSKAYKALKNVETGETYISREDASNKLGTSLVTISRWLKQGKLIKL